MPKLPPFYESFRATFAAEHVALLGITTLEFPRSIAGLAWIRDVSGGAEKD